ncbi:MAG: metallophosphoesterase family protein [Ginsengibacter sp.]
MNNKVYKKIAAMGGAYGNLPALKACVADAKQNDCDGLFFLGDAIGFAGHSDETLEFIYANFDIFLAGNLESQAALGQASCACGYGAAEDEITGCRAFEWSLKSLSTQSIAKLSTLPMTSIVSTLAGKILLCHGSPDVQNEFLYESEIKDEQILNWLENYGVSGFICTHTGIPWIKKFADETFAINCGVTGKPDHDGDTSIHYAIVDCHNIFKAEIRRVNYDFENLTKQLKAEGVEDIFIKPLKTGIWTCGVKSLPFDEQ